MRYDLAVRQARFARTEFSQHCRKAPVLQKEVMPCNCSVKFCKNRLGKNLYILFLYVFFTQFSVFNKNSPAFRKQICEEIENAGLEYVLGAIAYKLRTKYPQLGCKTKDIEKSNVQNSKLSKCGINCVQRIPDIPV